LGQIALIASYAEAGLMQILSLFGFAHVRRTTPDKEILPKVARVPVAGS
jgi:hypothetical protein